MVYFLQKENSTFPEPDFADEDGLLAVGGSMSVERLITAYSSGIFPWFSVDDIPFWYAPDPRFVLFPDQLKIAKSMQQLIKRNAFRVSFDTCFEEVIRQCATMERQDDADTWITGDFIHAYTKLHDAGFAHSVEVWNGDNLVGGLYGIALGKIFAGESMFSLESNSSKYGFIALVQKLRSMQFLLVDCQVHTPHLEKMGAVEIPRKDFMDIIYQNNRLMQESGNSKVIF